MTIAGTGPATVPGGCVDCGDVRHCGCDTMVATDGQLTHPDAFTGIVLAGVRGHRIGGADKQQDERMRIALEFLAAREALTRDSIATYLELADENLLGTWLIDSQQFGHPTVLKRIPRSMGCRDVYDIRAIVLTAHQMLPVMYRLLAELAETPSEAELFEQI